MVLYVHVCGSNRGVESIEAPKEKQPQKFKQIWRQRCCASGERLGTGSVFVLTRWDRAQPPAVDNLVLLRSAEVADRFDAEVCGFWGLFGWELWGASDGGVRLLSNRSNVH